MEVYLHARFALAHIRLIVYTPYHNYYFVFAIFGFYWVLLRNYN